MMFFAENKSRGTIKVSRPDGAEQSVDIVRGNYSNAGTRHSIHGHVAEQGKDIKGEVSYSEILDIDDVIATGSKTVGKKPNTYEYTLTKGKDKFVVVTEKKAGKEIFCDYYTNRKPSAKTTFTLTNTGGTKNLPTASSIKVENNSQTSNNSPEFMQLWRGSVAVFNHFDSSYFLSVEGSMFYGAGHYATG